MNENLARGYLAGTITALLDILVQRVEKDQKTPTEGTHPAICPPLIALQKDYRAPQDQHQIDIQRPVCPVTQTWI